MSRQEVLPASEEIIRRVVSATEEVVGMEIEPEDDNFMDDEGNETVELMMDPEPSLERVVDIPSNLTARKRSISCDSSLSDQSAGLIPTEQSQMQTEPSVAVVEDSEPGDRFRKAYQNVSLPPLAQPRHHGVATLPDVNGAGRMDESLSSESQRARSENSSNDWGYGWYEDVHGSEQVNVKLTEKRGKTTGLVPPAPSQSEAKHSDPQDTTAAAMAVTAPTYVLEESLSSQHLWKHTAGQRPPQPVEERAFFEKMWAQNFARSQVQYTMPVEVLTATSPVCLSPFAEGTFDGQNMREDYASGAAPPKAKDQGASAEATLVSMMNSPLQQSEDLARLPRTVRAQGSDGDLTILVRGSNAFGTTVSKSFAAEGGRIVTVNVSIASYRVVESHKGHKYAQFLVIYREGSIRDTLGVWKRYRDFEELAKKVTNAHDGCASVIANVSPLAVTEEPEIEHLPNAITSWRLLKKRKRWYRCLDAGYLSLKVFLLERFLHDICFESSSPQLLRDFVGTVEAIKASP